MKSILHEVADRDGKTIGYTLWCAGCDEPHVVYTNYAGKPQWKFNGNLDKPSFTPSLLVYAIPANDRYAGHPRCHSFITNGRMQFLGDCTHRLAGQTVPLEPWGWETD